MMSSERQMTAENRAMLIGTLLLFAGSITVGYAPIGLRLSVANGMGPQTTALWRFIFALLVIGLFFVFQRRLPQKPSIFAILTGIFFGLDIGFWHLSLTETSVANSTFIVNLGSICVGFLAWVFLKERPTWFWGAGVTLAVLGAWLLSRGGLTEAGSGNIKGDLLAALAACFIAFYFLNGRIARKTMDALDVLFWVTLTMCCTSVVFCFIFDEPLLPETASSLFWPASIALLAHIGGQGLIIAGLGKAPAAVAGIMVILQPVAAALVSWPLFGEQLASLQLAGAGLIVGALVISQLRLSMFRKATPSPTKLSQ